MTDSESDISNPNVFAFQNANTTVSARGPNTNITNFSFRNPLTSTMHISRNFERQRYAESVSDQRSIYYRREMSPMSIHSACDMRSRDYQHFYGGMSSQRSNFNGRSGSPMSMRSINSSASVSAAEIAFAFKNVQFNKYDLKVIKEAYHKLMKQRNRKRIEKRRNKRMFLKGGINRAGGDSGEQGSDSSISSDDCRSVKTSYKENISYSRLAMINPNDLRKTIKDSNMVKDCTDSLRQNTFKSMLSSNSNFHGTQKVNSSLHSNKSLSIPSLKERFNAGFVLPSQRFNKSVVSTVIPENSDRQLKAKANNYRPNERYGQNKNICSESEETIFPEPTVQAKNNYNSGSAPMHKRTLDSGDELNMPDRKKIKNASPKKIAKPKTQIQPKAKHSVTKDNNNIENSNNFEFTKPTLPVRKSKPNIQEKVIAKSKHTEPVNISPKQKVNNIETVQSTNIITHEKPDNDPIEPCELSQNSDVSMRPSFIKRKLFTQTLDVAEKGNVSSDASNSPQNMYSAIQKEKHKTRKLVTNQSCMSREVQDDNNLLDLIHKIVPPDCINKTNQTIMNQTRREAKNKKDEEDTWDVTSVLSMCDENNVSDTFTDEEIFKIDDKKRPKSKNVENINHDLKTNTKTNSKAPKNGTDKCKPLRQCKIILDKIPSTNSSVNIVKNSAKTFWDTDFESDAECQNTTHRNNYKENEMTVETETKIHSLEKEPEPRHPVVVSQKPALKNYIKVPDTTKNTETDENISKTQFKHPGTVSLDLESKNDMNVPETSRWLNIKKNTPAINETIDNSRRLNSSSISVRSHRTSKKKKNSNETVHQEMFFKKASQSRTDLKNDSHLEINFKNASKAVSKPPETMFKTISKPPESMTETIATLKPSENLYKTKSNSNIQINSHTEKKKKISSQSDTNEYNTKLKTKNISSNINPHCVQPITNSCNKTSKNKSKDPKKETKPTTTRNSSNSRSTSNTRKSPRASKLSTNTNPKSENTKIISTLNRSVSNRPIRSCRTPNQSRLHENSRSSRQFNITPLNIILRRSPKKRNIFNDSSLLEITPLIKNNLKGSRTRNCSLESNNKSAEGAKLSKNNVQNKNISKKLVPTRKSPRVKKSKPIKEMLNHQTPKIDRPIRLCRTPSHNRSMENYKKR